MQLPAHLPSNLPPDIQGPLALLKGAALHEVYSSGAGLAAGNGALLAFARQKAAARPILWARHACLDREIGSPYPPGLAAFGVDPSSLILARAADPKGVLQAGFEGARCKALGAVIIELWGEVQALDLTASRRLVLAAKASGVSLFLGRFGAKPRPSACETRWLVEPASSRPLEADAPGRPSFLLTLLRHRGGLPSAAWHMEWDRDHGCFEQSRISKPDEPRRTIRPSLSGSVVPFPVHGQAGAKRRRVGEEEQRDARKAG